MMDMPQGGTVQTSDPPKAAKLQKHSGCTWVYEWKQRLLRGLAVPRQRMSFHLRCGIQCALKYVLLEY